VADRADRLGVERREALLDPAGDAVRAGVDGVEVGDAFAPPLGDLVEVVLDPAVNRCRRAGELRLQQGVRGEAGEGGHELAALLAGVAALLDGVEDGGVGAGPPDALLLELLDQRGLGVAGRRLGLVAAGGHPAAGEAVVDRERRQRLVAGRRGVASGSSLPST
jgi:hypothetical protein